MAEMFMLPNDSALRGYFQVLFFADAIHRAVRNNEPNLNSFGSFEDEIKLLHRGLFSVLRTIDAPLSEFVALGLRTGADAWQNHPADSQTALEEVGRIAYAIQPVINVRNGSIPLPNYHTLFQIEIHLALDEVQMRYNSPSPYLLNMSPEQAPDAVPRATDGMMGTTDGVPGATDALPGATDALPGTTDALPGTSGAVPGATDALPGETGVVPGATDEQINAMPVYIATSDDDEHICSICFSNVVAGEPAKIINCSHWFHKKCIDTWLKTCAICPMDRSRVFPS